MNWRIQLDLILDTMISILDRQKICTRQREKVTGRKDLIITF